MDRTTKEKILSKALTLKEEAEDYFEEYVEPLITYRNQVVMGNEDYYDEKMPNLSERSKYISGDAFRIVESKVGKQLKIYFGGQDVIQVTGMNETAAADRQKLANYQLTEVNKGFTLFQQAFWDAFVNLNGFLKVCHYKREEWVDLPPIPATTEMIAQMKADKNFKIKDVILGMVGYIVTGKIKKIVEQYPKIEVIPVEDFLISPRAKSISQSDFVCHRPLKTLDEIKRNSIKNGGMYWDDAVKQLMDAPGGDDALISFSEEVNPEDREYPERDNDQQIRLYECYMNFDINGDGLMEPIVCTFANKTLLRAEENVYERVPIFRLPVNKSNKFWPDAGMVDYVCKLTEMDTAMWRLWISNLSLNNDPQMGVVLEAIEDLADLEDRAKIVKFRGVEDINKAIRQLPIMQMDASTSNFFNFKEQKLEKISTVTRINQGVGGEAQGLNKTASGMQLTVGLSNQDDENTARVFAESEDGIADMMEFMVELNEMYPPPEEEVLQLLGHPMTPLDGTAKLRFTVDPTLGTGVKQQNIQNLMMLTQEAPLLMQVGLMNINGLYNIEKRKYEEMGIKNVENYLINPQEAQSGLQQSGIGLGQDGLVGGVPTAPVGQIQGNAGTNAELNGNLLNQSVS